MDFKRVLGWASNFRAEDGGLDDKEFYWTRTAKQLLFKLENESDGFIGLMGLSDIGKSQTLKVIEKKLDENLSRINFEQGLAIEDQLYVVAFKWSPDETLWDSFEQGYAVRLIMMKLWRRDIVNAFLETRQGQRKLESRAEHLEERGRSESEALETARKEISNPYSFKEFEEYEKTLKEKVIRDIKERLAWTILSKAKSILIDSTDYSRNDVRLLNRDLTQIGELWSRLRQHSRANILVTIQKELYDRSGGHFTVGKMTTLTLEPLKPEELVANYKQIFEGKTDPFNEDALLLIATLSRGIYRRFKKYVQATIECVMEERPITVEDVKAAISEDQLIKDMELELGNLFTSDLSRAQAVKTINYVRERGECNQKEIAEFLDISEAVTGKLLSKLVAYNYLKRKRGQGKEWIIHL